jgi:hypothetical protein
MKKKLLLIITLIFTFFISNVYASDVQYEVLYKMENELKDNTFTIQLGLREESTMAVMSSVVYNQEKLEFVSIEGNDYFTVTKGKDLTNGVFKSFKILADSDYGFQKVYYANLTFRIKEDFKPGERTEIYFSNNKVATADELLKTAPSMTFTVFYDKDGTVSYVAQEQTFMTQINMYLNNNWKKVLYCLGAIIFAFIIIRYTIITKDLREYNKKHDHNHIVKKMRFAKVPKKFKTIDDDDKPEKIRIAKLGKWGKKKVKEQPVQAHQANINDLMKAEPVAPVQQEIIPERGVFIGNQDTGDENMLPDDFSSFTESSNGYAYDDDTTTSEISTEGAVNLDNLTNQSLQDDNNSKLGVFLGLLLVFGLFNLSSVKAISDDEMNNLRNMILGNMAWSAEYDINNDNSIDMLDIIALKDINNITIIQDTMTVSDSKPQATFNLKSTSRYVRTTKNGTTKVRTTANGKWKHDNTNPPINNNGGTTTSGETRNSDGEVVYTPKEFTTKTPVTKDASNGETTKYKVQISYFNGSGDYDSVELPYDGSITFNVYPNGEGYQNLNGLFCTSGNITHNGYTVTISNVINQSNCSITFGKSNSINANVNINYHDSDRRIENNVINMKNQAVDTMITSTVKFDDHYEYQNVICNGGFKDYSFDPNTRKFSGSIAEYSGTCTINMKPKKYTQRFTYNNREIYSTTGEYHSTVKGITLFESSFTSNLKLYCGSTVINPKSVEKTSMSEAGIAFNGYRYVFDVKIEGTDCVMK